MKKASRFLLTLAALYMLGLAALEKKKKLCFYGLWKHENDSLRFSTFGICVYHSAYTTSVMNILEIHKIETHLSCMCNLNEGETYAVKLETKEKCLLDAYIHVTESMLYYKKDEMSDILSFHKS